ncbi:MAG: hypothetical protein MI861_08495 [Pirellulales bacterium]|nr:hypothetical protein [Pirellulales bacterium]
MRTLCWISVLWICFVSGGATCARRNATLPLPPPPVLLTDVPTLQELAAAVNRTDNITQLSSNSTSVEVLSRPDLPRLTSSSLHLQRDQRFRLRASLPILLGAGVDMGSNEEVFWFEVPERLGKTLYYARHDLYQQQLHRAVLPVAPTWLMDALGLVRIDPATVVGSPVRRADGQWEVRNTLTMPDGVYQRVCFVQPQAGYVTRQYLYAPNGALIAQSNATNHVYYEEAGCALPHQVDLTLTPAGGTPLSMRISVGAYAVNQLLSGDPNLFVMPQTASKFVDLTTVTAPPTTAPPTAALPTTAQAAGTPIQYSATAPTPNPMRGSLR